MQNMELLAAGRRRHADRGVCGDITHYGRTSSQEFAVPTVENFSEQTLIRRE
jgi:hypothetical protein